MGRPCRTPMGIAVLALSVVLASALSPASARDAAKTKPAATHVTKTAKAARARPAVSLSSRDAAIIVDGASGRVLYSRNADATRRPASLTKMMTLYLLFGELEEGNVTLNAKMIASEHASVQEPTKLGLRPGEQVDVETAIKAVTVLSANDVAVMIAENIGRTEEEFARRMTTKARELGMTNTNFHNASGLPDDLQYTTARDMALLGRHLAYDYPQYYTYFSVPSFTYEGRFYNGHDHLLGEFEGTDGIKTGYTRASGFNLVTSAVRDNKHIVGVVMGGMSWASRDAEMVRLLSAAFDFAAQNPAVLADANAPWRGGKGPVADPFNIGNGQNVLVASLNLDKPTKPAKPEPAITTVAKPAPATVVAAAQPVQASAPAAKIIPASVVVPTEAATVAKAPAQPTTVVASALPPPVAAPSAPAAKAPAAAVVAAAKAPAPRITVKPVPKPVMVAAVAAKPAVASSKPVIPFAAVVLASAATPATKSEVDPASTTRSAPPQQVMQSDVANLSLALGALKPNKPQAEKHWAVQIGAYASQTLAEAQLSAYAKTSGTNIVQADRYVSSFTAFDGRTLYRARFGPFGENQARDICNGLMKHGASCFTTAQSY